MGLNPWSIGEVATNMNMNTNMDSSLPSIWNCHENVEDFKYKYIMELENLRNNVDEELKKRDETMVQLVQLVLSLTRERDELREQLQFILSKIKQVPANMNQISAVISQIHPDSSQQKLAMTNSTVTESDNLSATLNHASYGSSAAEHTRFDTVQSPELSSVNMAESYKQPKIQESKIVSASTVPKFDHVSAIIDNLAAKKPLPDNGKFLQSVLESGPLLQTLILAGPLPEWRNPPPLQPLRSSQLAAKPPLTNHTVVQRPNQLSDHSTPFISKNEYFGASHIQAMSKLNCSIPSTPRSSTGKQTFMPPCISSYGERTVKRQRF